MPDEPQPIVVEFHDGAPEGLQELADLHPEDVTILSASAFNATDPGVTELLVVGVPVVLKQVTAIVRAHIEARRHVSVKVDGIELTGLDAKDAIKVLEELERREVS